MIPIPHPIPVGAHRRAPKPEAVSSHVYFLAWNGFFMLAFAALLFVCVLAFSGCSTTAREEQKVIDEGVALVRGWEPDGPKRSVAKQQFLLDAMPYLSPSPSPSPAGGTK